MLWHNGCAWHFFNALLYLCMLLVLDRCDVIIVEMIIIVCCGGILGIYRVNSHKRDLLLSIIRVRYKKRKQKDKLSTNIEL